MNSPEKLFFGGTGNRGCRNGQTGEKKGAGRPKAARPESQSVDRRALWTKAQSATP